MNNQIPDTFLRAHRHLGQVLELPDYSLGSPALETLWYWALLLIWPLPFFFFPVQSQLCSCVLTVKIFWFSNFNIIPFDLFVCFTDWHRGLTTPHPANRWFKPILHSVAVLETRNLKQSLTGHVLSISPGQSSPQFPAARSPLAYRFQKHSFWVPQCCPTTLHLYVSLSFLLWLSLRTVSTQG